MNKVHVKMIIQVHFYWDFTRKIIIVFTMIKTQDILNQVFLPVGGLFVETSETFIQQEWHSFFTFLHLFVKNKKRDKTLVDEILL